MSFARTRSRCGLGVLAEQVAGPRTGPDLSLVPLAAHVAQAHHFVADDRPRPYATRLPLTDWTRGDEAMLLCSPLSAASA